MYFSVKIEKTQDKPKLFQKTQEKTQGCQKKTQELKIGSKNPRSWEKTQVVATLDTINNRLKLVDNGSRRTVSVVSY